MVSAGAAVSLDISYDGNMATEMHKLGSVQRDAITALCGIEEIIHCVIYGGDVDVGLREP